MPSALGLMVTDDELQGLVLSERILDAVDFVSMLEQCQSPAPKASENHAVRRDENRVAEGRVRHPDGLVELAHHTDPVEFIQRSMQPQLFWGTNNRTPLRPTYRGRIERLRRNCRDNLCGARTANSREVDPRAHRRHSFRVVSPRFAINLKKLPRIRG